MSRLAIGSLVLWLASLAPPLQTIQSARAELAPTGTLRVGINFGNALLVTKDSTNGEPRGVAVDLARELARRLGAAVQWVSYEAAGRMADGARAGAWDVAFLGVEPERAEEIIFTAPYLEVPATYLVPAGSALRTIADVDREGVRIAVSDKSAYDLYLSRTLRRARLMRAPSTDAALALFLAEKIEAVAGLKPVLLGAAQKLPGSRVLDGRFTIVQQAVGTPKGRGVGAQYLRLFVESVKASGFVAQTIEKNSVQGVSVAPAQRVQ